MRAKKLMAVLLSGAIAVSALTAGMSVSAAESGERTKITVLLRASETSAKYIMLKKLLTEFSEANGLEEPESDVPDRQKFEYVIVCKFDDDDELQTVLEMDWDTFLRNKRWHSRMHAWNLSLTKKLCQQCKIVYKKEE